MQNQLNFDSVAKSHEHEIFGAGVLDDVTGRKPS